MLLLVTFPVVKGNQLWLPWKHKSNLVCWGRQLLECIPVAFTSAPRPTTSKAHKNGISLKTDYISCKNKFIYQLTLHHDIHVNRTLFLSQTDIKYSAICQVHMQKLLAPLFPCVTPITFIFDPQFYMASLIDYLMLTTMSWCFFLLQYKLVC